MGSTISWPGMPLASVPKFAGRRIAEHPVDEPAAARLDDDRVARPQLVQVQEGRAAAHPVPGERDVALLAGERRPEVVPRALGQLVLVGALDDHPVVVRPQARDVQDRERLADGERPWSVVPGASGALALQRSCSDWSSLFCAWALNRSVTQSS